MAEDVFGFNADDVGRIREVVSFVEKSPRYTLKERRYRNPPHNEPQLFIALETFSLSSGGAEVCQGARDARVGRCAKLDYDINLYDGFAAWPISYQRVMGEAHCVWQPAETGCSSVTTEIKCGEYFWGYWNGQSGRYEALSNGRHDTDATNDGSACPCKWYGYALWKVVVTDDVAAWVLDENHCSGCYDATESREVIAVDHRFEETNLNDDWIETPGADPEDYRADNPDGRHHENFRYVTCCGVPDDDPPPPPCDLACCYSVPVPLPSCTNPTSVSQVVLRPTTGDINCSWASGTLSYMVWNDSWGELEYGCPASQYDITRSIEMRLNSVVMLSTGQIIYDFALNSRSDAPPGSGIEDVLGWLSVTYNLNATPNCSNDPTATKAGFQTNMGTYFYDCTMCERDMAWLSSLFPTTITATRIACDETTTTNTSTSSTTTASTTTASTTTGSTTTASTTTGSTTTASTTTGSTTTVSSTTTDTTTGSTTTGSTTTAPCTDSSCTYVWNGATWDLFSFCANGGCACDSPGFSGMFVGQSTSVTCRNA